MTKKLIMPKQTGKIDAFYSSLQLYYKSFRQGQEWCPNSIFKIEIQTLLPYLSEGARDGAYLVKQSELTRYFGLVEYDYTNQKGKARITERGIRFYEAYLQNNDHLQKELILESILNDSFGRNNTAVKSSNSNIDPPKLFLRAIVDLGEINGNDFAYLIYLTNDLNISYEDAITELINAQTVGREIRIPLNVNNKYRDVKFNGFLQQIGLCTLTSANTYKLSEFTENNYLKALKNLSIYNRKPDFMFTLQEQCNNDDSETLSSADLYQENVIASFGYDMASPRFIQQNNRSPQALQGVITRFSTNTRIAKTALELAQYKCAMNAEEHQTFITMAGNQYMEAHHLVPMCAQRDFAINLDRIENIVSLCPICHRGIHLGNKFIKLDLLKKLYILKKESLISAGINISFDDLYNRYYL